MNSKNKNHLSPHEWVSVQIVKNPSKVILTAIIAINLFFICLAASLISVLAADYVAQHGFWASIFYTLTMIMDAGCISYVVSDLGNANAMIVIICIVTIIVGMIFFTGGIIGYVSNLIANFIENSNTGKRPLDISGHTVILNWNTKASEIVNDMLYSDKKELVVVLANENKDEIETEIESRIVDSINQENRILMEKCTETGLIPRYLYYRKNRFKRNLTVIVREGETFSNKQLMDISVDKARSIIILNKNLETEKEEKESTQIIDKGNPITIKTMALVAEITSNENSADDQKIIVEVEDPWTENLVKKVISHKEKLAKCNIVPVPVTKILGQLLSQFAIMPELNRVYSELFSNKDEAFYCAPVDEEVSYDEYMKNHFQVIPLTTMDVKTGKEFFYASFEADDHYVIKEEKVEPISFKLNKNYRQPRSRVLILGHNSKIVSLMDGFESYRNEWNDSNIPTEILEISVIDDKDGLTAIDYYKGYRYMKNVIETDIYNQELIYQSIEKFLDDGDDDKVILILSDDMVSAEDLDSSAMTFLIYVQDIFSKRTAMKKDQGIRVDVVAEILDPKNYDVVRSYNVNNVIISNRYLSKMITQLGEKEALFEFYSDILTYDEENCESYESMEVYIKKVDKVFDEIPKECTAAQLIRGLYNSYKEVYPGNISILLGYINNAGEMKLLCKDQHKTKVKLESGDRLIFFSNH